MVIVSRVTSILERPWLQAWLEELGTVISALFILDMDVGHVQASRARLSRWWDAEAELSVVSKWLWAAVQEKGFHRCCSSVTSASSPPSF